MPYRVGLEAMAATFDDDGANTVMASAIISELLGRV
jgi:hypothetical protein